MEALLHLPAVRDHLDLQGLRRLSDTLATNIAGLRALGEREESYSKVISPVVMSRLPTEIQLSIGKELEAAARDISRLTTAIAARERYVDAAKRAPPHPEDHTPLQQPSLPTAAHSATRNTLQKAVRSSTHLQPEQAYSRSRGSASTVSGRGTSAGNVEVSRDARSAGANTMQLCAEMESPEDSPSDTTDPKGEATSSSREIDLPAPEREKKMELLQHKVSTLEQTHLFYFRQQP